MLEPKAFMGGTEAGEKIYICGGWADTTLAVLDEYEPAKDRWTRRTSMSIPRQELFACSIDGKVYALGGVDPQDKYLSLVEEIDTGSLPTGVESRGKLFTLWGEIKR
ncbi:hypothetical protein FJZ33_10070 [Candidatus Poribacteria bacterium]|nr:hypothetical protein [Candidatus Poribacteria bacterium]